MKTAVSLPDELLLSANDLAQRQGMSRSELFAVALAEYLAKHRDENVTAKLNEVLADQPSGLDPAWRRAQARSVARVYGSRCTSASAIPRSPATAYRK